MRRPRASAGGSWWSRFARRASPKLEVAWWCSFDYSEDGKRRVLFMSKILLQGASLVILLTCLAGCRPAVTFDEAVAQLNSRDPSVGRRGARALKGFGGPAAEPLLQCLNHSIEIKSDVVEALVGIGAPAVEPAMRCLADTNQFYAARQGAAETLGKLRDARGLGTLVAALRDPDRMVSYAAVLALGDLGDARAVEPLIECLRGDPEAKLLGGAAESLAKLHAVSAREPLMQALPGDWNDFDFLGGCLAELGCKPTTKAEEVYFWSYTHQNLKLVENWEQTKAVLVADLKSGERRRFETAVRVLLALDRAGEWLTEIGEGLDKCGELSLAQRFLDSDSLDLSSVAKHWAARHGYEIQYTRRP